MTKLTRLKIRILEEGLTQREVSRRSGIDEAILSLISNGKYLPDRLQRVKIAEAMREPEGELFAD